MNLVLCLPHILIFLLTCSLIHNHDCLDTYASCGSIGMDVRLELGTEKGEQFLLLLLCFVVVVVSWPERHLADGGGGGSRPPISTAM